MISEVTALYNPLVNNKKYDLSADKTDNFGEILQTYKCGYNNFMSDLRRIYSLSYEYSYFNEIDVSKVPLWKRKDFPKAMVFEEECTLHDLNRVKLPKNEPRFDFDPEVQEAWGDISEKNSVSFIIDPKAAEKLESDPAFYKKVMENILKVMPINTREMVAADFKALGSTLIDLSTIITISEDGGVSYDGYCSGMPEIKPEEETKDVSEKHENDDDKTYYRFNRVGDQAVDLTPEESLNDYNISFESYISNLASLAFDYKKKR